MLKSHILLSILSGLILRDVVLEMPMHAMSVEIQHI